jgi:hypothetical protein
MPERCGREPPRKKRRFGVDGSDAGRPGFRDRPRVALDITFATLARGWTTRRNAAVIRVVCALRHTAGQGPRGAGDLPRRVRRVHPLLRGSRGALATRVGAAARPPGTPATPTPAGDRRACPSGTPQRDDRSGDRPWERKFSQKERKPGRRATSRQIGTAEFQSALTAGDDQ